MRYVLLFLFLSGCATGSHIVTGQTRPPVPPESVKVLLEPPAKYETIGLVSAEGFQSFTAQQTQDYAVAELKQRAAKLGANAVILRETGDKTVTSATYNKFSGFNMTNANRAVLKGEAIWMQ